jgi:hypothetical protein
MGNIDWRIKWGAVFLLAAIIINAAHYMIFGDAEYIGKFVIAQLAFLPVSVFLVTVVLNQLLAKREKQALLNKMNMVIGAFYSEVGNELLSFVNLPTEQRKLFMIRPDWRPDDFHRARNLADESGFRAICAKEQLPEIKGFLSDKRDFLLSLLGNPNLLEHDSFTELLWAVLHLTEELARRADIALLPLIDIEHLIGDVQRAFKAVLTEWLSYMRHLQKDYPYLFSLAVRTNPFDPESHPEFKE